MSTVKLPSSRRSFTARLLDEARQVEEKLTESFRRSTTVASDAAVRATGGAAHLKELSSKLQRSAGNSSSRLNAIRDILTAIEALHKDCQKDKEEEEALLTLLQQLQNTSGASGRREPSPRRRSRTPRRNTLGASGQRHQSRSPRRNTLGASGQRLRSRSPRRNTLGASGQRQRSRSPRRHHYYQQPYRRSTTAIQASSNLTGANAVPINQGPSQPTTVRQLAPSPPAPQQLQSSLWGRRSPAGLHTPPSSVQKPPLLLLLPLVQRQQQPTATELRVPKPLVPLPSPTTIFDSQPTTSTETVITASLNSTPGNKRSKSKNKDRDGGRKQNESLEQRIDRGHLFTEPDELPSEEENRLLKTPKSVSELSKNLQEQSLTDSISNVVST